MPAIAIRELYSRGLRHFAIAPVANALLKRVIAGDDQAEDFEEAIQSDSFFTRMIITEASRQLKRGSVKSLAHAVVLLGKDNVRGFVLGHSIQRIFDSQADGKAQKFSDNRKLLMHMLEAESLARSVECDYVGSALAAGYIHDIFAAWLQSDAILKEKFQDSFAQTWKHAKRTAALSWTVANHPNVNSNSKKLAFTAGLLHEVGRLLLFCSYPQAYAPLLAAIESLRAQNPHDDNFEVGVDQSEFRLAHPEVGSLLVFATGCLKEWEEIVDYHHDTNGLKTRAPSLHSLAVVLQLADHLACAQEKKPLLETADIDSLLTSWNQVSPLSEAQISGALMTLSAKQISF
jgi:HD-like signal output (HDOD) protein